MSEKNFDISHLSGSEIERIARSLSVGAVEAILADKKSLVSLKAEELMSLNVLIAAARVAHCGGFGCG